MNSQGIHFNRPKISVIEPRRLTMLEVLHYEVSASPWASYVGWVWLQNLCATYFANKANRKWKRYVANEEAEKNVREARAHLKR